MAAQRHRNGTDNSPAPTETLATRLRAEQARVFVGRKAELAQFRALLDETPASLALLCIVGPGGVGKTTLLHRFEEEARSLGGTTLYFSARGVEPSPRPFLAALRQALEIGELTDPVAYLRQISGRKVLMVDTFEQLAPLQSWLRGEFLPQLPADLLVIVAGRHRLDARWRTDPGWNALTRTISLRNLSPEESERLLAERGITPDYRPTIIQSTYGHPLALMLMADLYAIQPKKALAPLDSDDVVATLVARFCENVPGPLERAALEATTMVRQMSEGLLSELLDVAAPASLCDWLRGLSFIEVVPGGLMPHALVRDILAADVRWRNPELQEDVHRRARAYYNRRLQATDGARQQAILIDYIYLHRNNPVVQPYFEQFRDSGRGEMTRVTDVATADDWPVLRQMVAEHEGDEGADLFDYWQQRQPQKMLVFRESDGRPLGLLMELALEETNAADGERDPAVAAAVDFLQRKAPLRPGERATHFRFWLDGETHQGISPTQGLIFVTMVRHYLTTPRLAYTFLPCAEPDAWSMIFRYADLARIDAADYSVGGRHYGVFGHDWRAVPIDTWLELLGERETARNPQLITRKVVTPLLVLSRPVFETAVTEALRDFTDVIRLAQSPLLRAQIVDSEVDGSEKEEERVEGLRRLLNEAAAALEKQPRGTRYYRAVYHTYLQPAPTQELAAEIIDVPYGTFRRHLKRGVGTIVDLLWQREINS